jgi:catechol 2,3-dioxygenase-like lactoylglutathione lyase family enzyme
MAPTTSASLLLLALATLVSAAQPAVQRPRITGINHVALRTSDAAKARTFYGDLLGLPSRPGQGGRIEFTVGARQHVQIDPGLPPDAEERLSHLAFETPDLPALRAFLSSRGVGVKQPDDRCGSEAFRVVDPDGHTIEFVQAEWPPPLPPLSAGRALSTRVQHAGLIVRDEHAAHRFYSERLGFAEFWRGGRTEGVTSWIYMRVPDGTDHLEYMLVTQPPDRRERGVRHHVCLLVPDIQRAWETVVQRSPSEARAALSPPSIGRNGRWQLNIYDPDGTRIELMEPFTIR